MGRQPHKISCIELSPNPGISLFHTGPALDHGPLPSFFYFSLSGPDSLCLDPYNQPVQFLQGKMVRVFSMTLPAHEGNLDPKKALEIWEEDYQKGLDPLGEFLDQAQKAVEFAIQEQFVDPAKMAVGGLSRGALIAFHLAARERRFGYVLGHAPLTHFQPAPQLAAEHVAEAICNRKVRLYISNVDAKVGTKKCIHFAMKLVEEAEKKSIRSPQIELFLYPPIGYMGHGTAPHIFSDGANWISQCLISSF